MARDARLLFKLVKEGGLSMLILRLVRHYRRIRRHKSIGVGIILALLTISILGNALVFHYFEGTRDGHTFGDALWYSIISVTTIGYGDFSAVSPGARLGTVFFVVILGLATFSVFIGMAIDWISDLSSKGQRGMGTVYAKDHVLIVNVPSVPRVVQLIEELRSDPQHQGREIVVISDTLERLPFEREDVLFVRGPLLEQETYERARAAEAKMAIILATSYEDAKSDAIVASTIAVIDSIKPDLHIVAECLNEKHRMLFDSVHCDAIIFSLQLSGNLLAQEAHDPGISRLVDVITSNVRGTTLYTSEVNGSHDSVCYNDLAKTLLDRDVNLLAVNRNDECLTSFVSLHAETGDRVVYAAQRRLSWDELLSNGSAVVARETPARREND